jgi:hypothetical protein
LHTNYTLPKNAHGFSPVIGIVAIVIIAAFAVGGWTVWHRQDNSRQKTNNATSTQTDDKTATDSDLNDSQKPNDPSENGKYFVIKEWGVRFVTPTELQDDISYGLFNAKDGSQIIYFASKDIAAVDPGCGLKEITDSSGSGMYGGNIALTRTNQPDSDTPEINKVYVGDNWYVLGFGNGGPCSEETHAAESRFKVVMTTALRNLKSID